MTSYHKFPQVDHADATGELKEVYQDIQATLRVPWVAFACRVLATFPGYLSLAWRAAQPNFATRYAERAADTLRERSLLPGPNPPDPRPKLRELGWDDTRINAVRRAVDAFNYGNPKYLLLLTAWYEAFHNRPSGEVDLSQEDAARIPLDLPEGVAPLQLVDPDTASPEVQALLKRITDLHFHHGAASDFRVLANWPDYLRLVIDEVLGPVVRTEAYNAVGRALLVQTRDLIRGFPAPAGVSQDEIANLCSPAEIAGLSGLLFMYQRFIADVTIDLVRVKQALDGPGAAAASPFPIP
jgi:hypothetical protein